MVGISLVVKRSGHYHLNTGPYEYQIFQRLVFRCLVFGWLLYFIISFSEAAFRAEQHPGGPLKMTFVQIASPSEDTKSPQQGFKPTKIRKAVTPHPSKTVKYHNGTLINAVPLEPVLNQTVGPTENVSRVSLVIPKEVKSQNEAKEKRMIQTAQNSQVKKTAAMRKSLVIAKPQINTQSPAFNVSKVKKYVKKGMKTSAAETMPNNTSNEIPSKPDLQNTYSTEEAELDQFEAELSKIKNEKDKLNEKLIDLGHLRVELANSNVENKKIKVELANSTVENKKLRENLLDMERLKSELAYAKFETKKYQEKFSNFDRKSADFDQMSIDFDRMKYELARVKSGNEKLIEGMADFEKLEMEFDQMKVENEKLIEELAEFDQLKDEFNQVKWNHENLKASSEKEIGNVKYKLQKIGQRNQELESELKSGKVEELEKERESMAYYINKVEAELNEQVKQLFH